MTDPIHSLVELFEVPISPIYTILKGQANAQPDPKDSSDKGREKDDLQHKKIPEIFLGHGASPLIVTDVFGSAFKAIGRSFKSGAELKKELLFYSILHL